MNLQKATKTYLIITREPCCALKCSATRRAAPYFRWRAIVILYGQLLDYTRYKITRYNHILINTDYQPIC